MKLLSAFSKFLVAERLFEDLNSRKMAYEEGNFAQVDVEKSSQGVEQPKAIFSNSYIEEWVYFLPGSSHAQIMNSNILKDAYNF